MSTHFWLTTLGAARKTLPGVAALEAAATERLNEGAPAARLRVFAI
jgi:hypothetical protein